MPKEGSEESMREISFVGYVVGTALITVFIILPLAFMGLKSKNVFKSRSMYLGN